MDINNIRKKLVDFFSERFELEFNSEDEDLNFDTDLFEYGYIDSLESLVIINFLEKEFNISISVDDLIHNPINSLTQMANFVASK